jgi:hypothetical protein
MHLNLDELLALRDGEGSADGRHHVEGCGQCRAEIEELRVAGDALRALPQCPPPAGSWEVIRNRLATRRRRLIDLRLGVAAAVLLALATAAIIARLGPTVGTLEGVSVGDTRKAVEQLSNASRELELVLRDGSLRSPVLSPRQAAMIVELEDRIALIDLVIARSHETEPDVIAVALWSDRVELLDALVTARGGGVRNEGFVRARNRSQGSVQ